jgi:hypothetical protein
MGYDTNQALFGVSRLMVAAIRLQLVHMLERGKRQQCVQKCSLQLLILIT